jgi:hypothetical protein
MARAWLGILMMALIFGMIGCREEGTPESFLNGTWRANTREYYQDQRNHFKNNIVDYDYKITFIEGISVYEGIFEESIFNIPVCKGIYAVSGRAFNVQVTHIYRNNIGLGEEFGEEWLPIRNIDNEEGIDIAVIRAIFTNLPLSLSLIHFPQSYTCSIGTTLEMTTTVAEDVTPFAVTTTYRKIVEIE